MIIAEMEVVTPAHPDAERAAFHAYSGQNGKKNGGVFGATYSGMSGSAEGRNMGDLSEEKPS